jgi:hypothetical protein
MAHYDADGRRSHPSHLHNRRSPSGLTLISCAAAANGSKEPSLPDTALKIDDRFSNKDWQWSHPHLSNL